jgi:transcription antitermination factor NusG
MARPVDALLPPPKKVQILAGSFLNFVGMVFGELPERGKVMVTLSVFGRPMAIELDREQVRAIN